MTIANTLTVMGYVYKTIQPIMNGIISGHVLKKGMRQIDAETEDAVIVVSDGDAEQSQSGHLHINIYVKDVDAGTGNLVANTARLEEIASNDAAIVDALNAGDYSYLFKMYRMTDIYEDPDYKGQHFVGIFVEFKKTTF